MRIGLISDIHGNLPALEAVLKELKHLSVDEIFCLGDTVGYGPFPEECVSLVRERCSIVLKGNHDSGLVGETPLEDFNAYGWQAIVWSRDQVSDETVAFLRNLTFTGSRDDLYVAHASPKSPDSWTYVLTLSAAQENFTAFPNRLCFIGHTHVPVIIGEDATINKYRKKGRFIINVGSVGQPRDGNPEACIGVYDTDKLSYSLVRIPYDIDRTAQAIRNAGLPEFLAQRLYQGL